MSKNEILTEAVETAEETFKDANIVKDYVKPVLEWLLMGLGVVKAAELIKKPVVAGWNKITSFIKKDDSDVVDAEVTEVQE